MAGENDIPIWLNEQYEKIAKDNGFIKYTIEKAGGTNHGEGFVGEIIKIIITGEKLDGNNHSISLICKTLPDNKAHREIFSSELLFEREVFMYNEIFPIFEKFQQEKLIPIDKQFFEYPKCYYAEADSATDRFVVIMEDLKPTGFELWDKLKSIDFEHVKLLMVALGKWHGLSYAIEDQLPEKLMEYKKAKNIIVKMLHGEAIDNFFNIGFDQTAALYDDGQIEKKLFLEYRQTWKQSILDMLSTDIRSSKFNVISHGDCWNNNMMFSDKKDSADKICLIDWQVSQLCSPVIDLALYFMTSTTKALRDKHYDEFLQIYYDTLSETVKLCGSDIDKVFKFSDLEDQLKEFGHYGIIMAPTLLNIIVSEPDNIVQMDKLAENLSNKPADGDGGSGGGGGDGDGEDEKTIGTFTAKSELMYRERISDGIHDAIKYGWLK